MSAEKAIEAIQLTKRFGDFTAVNQVSFEIPRGEIFDCWDQTELEKPPPSECFAAFSNPLLVKRA